VSTTDYITLADVQGYLYQAKQSDKDFIESTLIPAACSFFDRLCNVEAGYFKKVDATATAQIFYGNGMTFMVLPPFTGNIEEIVMPAPYILPRYTVLGQRLQALTSEGNIPIGTMIGTSFWPLGLAITIKAKWGSADKLPAVKQACAELVVAMWRSKDQAFLKAVQMETGQVLTDAIPVRVKATIASLRGEVTANAFV